LELAIDVALADLLAAGDPNVNMVNSPEIPGGKGTYASTGNYIPLMQDAKPGMLTVVDMPLPRFWTPTA
ncbi:MAG TPA: hypothetical protein VFD50_00480, partial [Thermoleophilia bacterium]|nr:hypothetical protein [Thermoleophilia bacterium]